MAGWINQWRGATQAIGQTQQAEIRYANGRVVNKKLLYRVTQTRIHQIPLMAGGREIGMTFQRKKCRKRPSRKIKPGSVLPNRPFASKNYSCLRPNGNGDNPNPCL